MITIKQIHNTCLTTYDEKFEKYGNSWHYFRPISLVDQVFMKLLRVRTVTENEVNLTGESLMGSLEEAVNYSAMTLSLLTETDYKQVLAESLELLEQKDADYGSAWRQMNFDSLIDIAIVKLARIKHRGDDVIAVENMPDVLNYCVFCIIKLYEHESFINSST